MSLYAKKPPHTLFLDYFELIQNDLNNVLLDHEENLVWLDEILDACKKALVNPDVELLPKTPSSKKPKRRIQKKEIVVESESEADDEAVAPPRRTRQMAKQKPNKLEDSERPTRQTRGRKQNSEVMEPPRFKIAPEVTSTNLSKMSDCSELELSDLEMTPVAHASSSCTPKLKHDPHTKYSVKERASAYESMLDKRSSKSPAVSNLTPVNKPRLCASITETPDLCATPDTVKHNRTISLVEKENHCEKPVLGKTAQKRRSSRKSLKVLSSKIKRTSAHMYHISRQIVENVSSKESDESEEPRRKPRTRLRLQKKDTENTIEDPERSSEDSNLVVDSSVVDNVLDTTYQSPVPVPKPRTSRNLTPIKSNGSRRSSLLKKTPTVEEVVSSSKDEVVMESESSDDGMSKTRSRHSNQDRDSGILSAQSSAVSLKNLETLDCVENKRQTRSKRSTLEMEEPKVTRKRQVDECDDASPAPKSKRSCVGVQPDQDVDEEVENPKTPVHDSTDSDQYESMDSSDECTPPRCPPNKIVRPAGLTNSANRSANRPSNLVGGFSFLKRNTPVKATPKSLDQRKREQMEKERKNEDRVQRKKEMLNKQVQERKRLREERMRKAAELRLEQERSLLNKKNENVKKMEERLTLKDKQKEERLKEDRLLKQTIRLQKQKEVEEKRKLDEEERLRKKAEQEEEDRRQRELLQKKKEVEELERQRRLAEEKHRHEERVAEMERERQLEKEKLLQIELERERENQRLKEEKEKQLAKEKAERERMEIEKKKDREAQIQREMIKLKEMEKARLAKIAAEKEEEQQKEKERMQKLLEKQQQAATVKPALNTTHNTSHSSHTSYDITPAKKKVKDNSNNQNYNINDLHSDDSTDDEDKPRKRIPLWAQGTNLKAALINQEYHPPLLEVIFPRLPDLDLNEVFIKRKPRFNKRTSSAIWDSPILKPAQNAQFDV